MTLRDWFAGQALSNMTLQNAADVKDAGLVAYAIADALLKARSEPSA